MPVWSACSTLLGRSITAPLEAHNKDRHRQNEFKVESGHNSPLESGTILHRLPAQRFRNVLKRWVAEMRGPISFDVV